ncbi:ABC transporter permease [Lacticaseibacillus zeae]|uniref:ABC transporter permease n=1 Tax=Lacticaseibacillus zeae subsp. silagei TaxID=3068307 RepID=A0ABD7ZB51_LACZE|nr:MULTISPECIES: ABC transporter permease [Lacticaseibacillus]MDE3314521.1 ABC transporter permease [Lacticaseibacillus zeae]OFR92449.1 ABC transporter permease [Lactobacillus sp. HMSC068F07]WLV84148.1 ABC transporter permease [Lacticaseibacillus sp. NCIMB 15475]WLV86904.1 ABC transporter permease [Lacticaseibacillus sp. NCIMB 15474]
MNRFKKAEPEPTDPAALPLPKNFAWLTRLRPTLEKRGIQFDQLRLILATKSLLASRESSGLGSMFNNNKRRTGSGLRKTFLWNTLFGAVLGLLLLIPTSIVTTFTMFMTVQLLTSFLAILTSYSSLILDPRDRTVFAARGVNDRTLSFARLLNICFYLGMTLLAMGGPGIVISGFHYGPIVAIGGFIALLFSGVLSLMLALFVYLLILRFFDGERLRNMLNLVQILLMIGIYVGGQLPNLLPQSMSIFGASISDQFSWLFIPAFPAWFAGLPMLFAGQVTALSLMLASLSVVIPIAMTLTFLHFSGVFEVYLEKLNQGNARPRKLGWWFRGLSALMTRPGEERTYFTLGWRILGSERDYKLRVYPQLAYGLILPLVFIGNELREMSFKSASHFIAYAGIGVIVALAPALVNLRFSSQPQAMAIFQYVPFKTHGLLLRGVVKAMFARLFLLPLVLITVITTAIGGFDALVAGIAVIILTYGITLIMGWPLVGSQFPFASIYSTNANFRGGSTGVISVIIGAIAAVIIIFVGGFLGGWIFPLFLTAFGLTFGLLLGHFYRTNLRYELRINTEPE